MFDFLRNRYFWLMLIVIVVALTVMQQTTLERKDTTVIEKMVRHAYTPLQRGVSTFRGHLGKMENLFVDKKRLAMKVRQLEKELENYRLDRNLTNMDLVAAQVIARNPTTWYNTITIDQGSSKGIARNMAVITSQGLVGRVTAVSSNYAVVILITDREVAVGAMVQENRVPGIIVGTMNGKQLQMSHIPFYSEVKKGNRVVTSRFSELYPPGIIIGEIDEVSVEPEALTKKATVISAVDLDRIEEVLVVKDYINPAPEWAGLETNDYEANEQSLSGE